MNEFCERHNIFHSDATCAEIDDIVTDPIGWYNRKKASRRQYSDFSYLITFTRNPNSRYSLHDWKKRIAKEVSRKTFSQQHLTIEHPDTNIHVHAVVKANKAISNTLFKVFSRDYGWVDVRRIRTDNGVLDYIAKELPEGQNPQNLQDFISSI